MPGLHFSYYITQSLSKLLTNYRYQLINIAISNKTPLDRWLNRVLVMLEKIKGNINVKKLRAILLLEADLNILYIIMFTRRVLPKLEE